MDIYPNLSDEELMKGLRREKAVKTDVETSNDDDDDDEDDDDDDEKVKKEQDRLAAFEGVEEDCKLVLVVHTDLGMNKDSFSISTFFKPILFCRQNCCSSLPRQIIQLQSPHLTAVPLLALAAVGVHRASENCNTSKIRRRAQGIAS